jgi:hypothetical protein
MGFVRVEQSGGATRPGAPAKSSAGAVIAELVNSC